MRVLYPEEPESRSGIGVIILGDCRSVGSTGWPFLWKSGESGNGKKASLFVTSSTPLKLWLSIIIRKGLQLQYTTKKKERKGRSLN